MSDVHEDIYNGLNNEIPTEKPIIFSLGHRCTSTSLIKELKLKFESYPFDWVVSKLDVIAHCIEDDFAEFLKVENYENKDIETFNLCDGSKRHITNETVLYNKYYEDQAVVSNDIGTYGLKLCMTHHDIRKDGDLQYFQRCVNRFRKIMSLEQKKYYLYVHPLMGFHDYAATLEGVKKYFAFFTDYFKTKTQNSFGLYFLMVQDEDRKGQVEQLVLNDDYAVYVVYANEKLVDGGGVFCGDDWYTEQYKILTTIEKHVN
jgi:hypothetical protein